MSEQIKTVWKYALKDSGEEYVFEIPLGANVLCVAQQGWNVCVWLCVIPHPVTEKRCFYFTGTGAPVAIKDAYVGTAFDDGLVWHVWEKK